MKALPRKSTATVDEHDLAILRSMARTGIPLRPEEIASEERLGMDADEVSTRLARLLEQGYVEDAGYRRPTYAATTVGAGLAYRTDLSVRMAKV